jgi:hypothetical protein
VLGASLTRRDAQMIERDARAHLDGFTSNGFALAVDLRKLQDGGAHLLRGYSNFGDYIEAKFAGRITAENAKKLSLTGKVVLALIEADRVTLAAGGHKAAHKTLGTTGARALSGVQSKHGPEAMLAVYDTAAQIAKDKGTVITDEIVKAVLTPQLPEPDPQPGRELEEDDSFDEREVELSKAERDLLELVGNLQDSCLTLENFIEHGEVGTEKAAAYAKDITAEAAKLRKALEAAVRDRGRS